MINSDRFNAVKPVLTFCFQNAERGSGGINHYVGLAQVMEETVRPVTGEHQPSTPPQHPRVVEDGVSTPPLHPAVVEDGESTPPPLPPRVVEDGESTPPLPPRLVEDGVTPHVVANLASHDSHGDLIQSQVNDKPPPDKITPDNGSSDPTYSQPVLPKASDTVTPPATTEKLTYDDIQGYQNQQVVVTMCM